MILERIEKCYRIGGNGVHATAFVDRSNLYEPKVIINWDWSEPPRLSGKELRGYQKVKDWFIGLLFERASRERLDILSMPMLETTRLCVDGEWTKIPDPLDEVHAPRCEAGLHTCREKTEAITMAYAGGKIAHRELLFQCGKDARYYHLGAWRCIEHHTATILGP